MTCKQPQSRAENTGAKGILLLWLCCPSCLLPVNPVCYQHRVLARCGACLRVFHCSFDAPKLAGAVQQEWTTESLQCRPELLAAMDAALAELGLKRFDTPSSTVRHSNKCALFSALRQVSYKCNISVAMAEQWMSSILMGRLPAWVKTNGNRLGPLPTVLECAHALSLPAIGSLCSRRPALTC
jgi:hypothetical protein